MKKRIFTILVTLMAIASGAQAQTTHNGHEYVDLGLPSGILWATMNVGASSPTEVGDKFAWGETEPKTEFTIDNYSRVLYQKYEPYSDPSYDNPTHLEIRDDAANAKWGGQWRMPTRNEVEELTANCTITKGEAGLTLTSDINGKSIFFPFNDAYYYFETIEYPASCIWTNSHDGKLGIYFFTFPAVYENIYTTDSYNIYYGMSVRAIYDPRTHTHDFNPEGMFSNRFYFDENNHYKACISTIGTCDGTREDVEAHTFDSENTCTVCGYTKTVSHIHSYSTEWTHDESTHWHACTSTVGTCDAPKADEARHTFNSSSVCTVCGFSSNPPTPPTPSTRYIYEVPDDWKVNGKTPTNGKVSVEKGDPVIVTPANIPAGKKIKSIKAVKKQ